MTTDPGAIREQIMRLLEARDAGKSICPSEVARALSPDWRPLMKPVRNVAIGLMRDGLIDILRKGRPIEIETSGQVTADVKGVIRLRRRAGPE